MCSVPFKNAIAILSCNEQGSNNNYSVIKLSITHGTWSCISSQASKRRPFFKCQKMAADFVVMSQVWRSNLDNWTK